LKLHFIVTIYKRDPTTVLKQRIPRNIEYSNYSSHRNVIFFSTATPLITQQGTNWYNTT